ncbi:toxin-antitoxin system, toxin component [Streptomyces sp. NPDC051018]|uniref:toxin-antitoxin system, toxin component n=1 Tax=Streptomyces sp. NPDC051018 TaxID=3365639 RepID=UPI0037908975
MRRLCARLSASLRLPAPADPPELFSAVAGAVSELRDREVRLCFLRFPPGTVSGIWLDGDDGDLIVVEATAPPQHQLVILGHEIWHMYAGHRGGHAAGAAAARALAPDVDLGTVVAAIAARGDLVTEQERAAELFGIMLGSELRPWLDARPGPGGPPEDGLAGRIQVSLGRRGVVG